MSIEVVSRAIPDMDRRHADERSNALSHLDAALNSVSSGLITFNRNLEILFVNDRLTDMLEIAPTLARRAVFLLELLGSSAVLDEEALSFLAEICIAAADAFAEHKSILTVSAGTASRFFSLGVTRLGDGHWMVSFEEVTARRSAEANAVEQARHDPLTGLHNRQLFQNRVVAALSPTELDQGDSRLAIMLIDLDRFKAVNDTLGHAIGDGLLRLVSKRLRTILRSRDGLARLGGDEFALLILPPPNRADMEVLAHRIVEVLGRPYLVDGHLVSIGASVGIAIAPRDGNEHGRLLRSADLALYQAKKAGRGRFSFFEPELDARALDRHALESDLRKALALHQFELHFQPQIDLRIDKVIAFEALPQWKHPERGMLSPADFVPLAEEIGLITQIGEWVLQEACRAAIRWPNDISVAVNIWPLQFADATRLLGSVTKSLSASGLPANRLEIEVTEPAMVGREEMVLTTLHNLRALGVRIVVDDFGSGYSSVRQLHSFPFSKIKIDRSFMAAGEHPGGQTAVIRAIVAFGASLGMDTVAEGVETADQLALIRAEYCAAAQGCLISRPVTESQVADSIAEISKRAKQAFVNS